MPLSDYAVRPAGYDGEIAVHHIPEGTNPVHRVCRWEWAPAGDRFFDVPASTTEAIDLVRGIIPVDKLVTAVVEHERTCPHSPANALPAWLQHPGV